MMQKTEISYVADACLQPDYWASLLWRRLMGTSVLRVRMSNGPQTVRAYAHRGAGNNSRTGTTFLLINLGDEDVAFEPPAAGEIKVWLLEGAAADSPFCTINGKAAMPETDGKIPDFPHTVLESEPKVPASSAIFMRV